MIISFEGIDGSGKSTACLSLSVGLSKRAITNVLSSSESLEGAVPEVKHLVDLRRQNLLGPTAMCLYRAADLAVQWENSIAKAMATGYVLLADRYIYTPLVRDVLRGVAETYIKEVYRFAVEPDLIIYLNLDPSIAFQRRIQSTSRVSPSECGGQLSSDPQQNRLNFILFQEQCRKRYQQILPKDRTVVVDSSRSVEEINPEIEALVLAFLRNPSTLPRSTEIR